MREFEEPALLIKGANPPHATYRLLEGGRTPRCARVIFDSVSGGGTVVLKHRLPVAARSMTVNGRPIPPGILTNPLSSTSSLDAFRGAQMRVLLDDEDRFWNGVSEPPPWGEITADDEHAILVTADGWECALEARVGSKRHVIVREAPVEEEWLGRIIAGLFGPRHSA